MGIDISRLGLDMQKQALQKLKQQLVKPSKYGNVKTQRLAGETMITFGSKKEAARYDELMTMLHYGLIRNLRLQAEYTLQAAYTTHEGKRIRAIRYLSDFSYEKAVDGGWVQVVEDVKSGPTRTAQYRMKNKMMQERLGIEITEV